jgi:lysophospholipase L1-like esterase
VTAPHRILLLAVVTTLGALCARANTATEAAPRDPRAVPADPHWMQRHEEFVARAHQGGIDVVFFGDSITDFWRDPGPDRGGREVWAAAFGGLRAVNFGIGADRTQHLLWRIQHGELDGYQPKAVVLLIGTNNIGFERDRPQVRRNTTAEALAGIEAVVREIRRRAPAAQLLLMALWPRGEASDPMRAQIRQINAALANLADGRSIRLIDIGQEFLTPDGSVDRSLMPDLLHPSSRGYQLWARALKEPLAEALARRS